MSYTIRKAPNTPNTVQLQTMHRLPGYAQARIRTVQRRATEVLRTGNGLIAAVGGCALVNDPEQLQVEGEALQTLEANHPGLVTAQRMNTWKPRSDVRSWWGMESRARSAVHAHEIVTAHATAYGNATMELGYAEHVARYKSRVAIGWLGARAALMAADEFEALLDAAARCYDMPIGIKNGQDGDLKSSLGYVAAINDVRNNAGAPAFLMYRGDNTAQTPPAWGEQYKRAWDLTEGRLVVDTAHGTMRAHTPDYGKSIHGQRAAMDHVIELSLEGWAPAGVLMEASDTASVVDPNAPHNFALQTVAQLAAIKSDMLTVNA